MRVLLFLLCLGMFSFDKLAAQQPVERLYISQDTSKAPFVLVDSFQTDLKYLFLNATKVKAVDVYKDSAAIKQFGEKGKNGVMVIRTTGEVTLLRLPALLDKYHFPDSLRQLRVCINEVIVARPELILMDESKIQGVNTMVLSDWNNLGHPKHETVINIIAQKNRL